MNLPPNQRGLSIYVVLSIDRASRIRTYGIPHVDVVMVMVILLRTPYKLQARKSTSGSTLQRSLNIHRVIGWVAYCYPAQARRRYAAARVTDSITAPCIIFAP